MIDQNKISAVAKEYSLIANNYDNRWQSFTSASISQTLQFINIKPGENLLDIGCGTGELLKMIHDKEPSANLYGLDLSADMLAIADQKLPKGINLDLGESSSLKYQQDKFDIIVSTNSLHCWADKKLSLRNITKVLKPGGKIIITDLCNDYFSMKLFELHIKTIRQIPVNILSSKALCKLASNVGLIDQRILKYRIKPLWGMMTLVAS